MSKISVIIKREYTTRVRKKSFIVLTILTPILLAALMIVPALMVVMEDDEVRKVAVIDQSTIFLKQLPETETIKFTYVADVSLEDFKKNLSKTDYYGVLYIPENVVYNARGCEFYSHSQPPHSLTMHMTNAIEKRIESEKLMAHNIENLDEILKSVKTNIDLRVFKLSDSQDTVDEKESYTTVNMVVAYLSAFMIYMFVFLFGGQVMSAVIEEKTSRIVEVIVSSVKPFQLMMGKVLGIVLVGLTQCAIWIVLTTILVVVGQSLIMPDAETMSATMQANANITSLAGDTTLQTEQLSDKAQLFEAIKSVNYTAIILCFLFYFVGGYLLYASLFAACGAAVDNTADAGQFTLPITMPMIIAIMIMMKAITNPDGALAFWCSIIPFTSPVIMMARIPFGVPYWELALSMALLILTFIGSIYISGKIYRTGILIYGKKPTYKELWKWIRYKS